MSDSNEAGEAVTTSQCRGILGRWPPLSLFQEVLIRLPHSASFHALNLLSE